MRFNKDFFSNFFPGERKKFVYTGPQLTKKQIAKHCAMNNFYGVMICYISSEIAYALAHASFWQTTDPMIQKTNNALLLVIFVGFCTYLGGRILRSLYTRTQTFYSVVFAALFLLVIINVAEGQSFVRALKVLDGIYGDYSTIVASTIAMIVGLELKRTHFLDSFIAKHAEKNKEYEEKRAKLKEEQAKKKEERAKEKARRNQ